MDKEKQPELSRVREHLANVRTYLAWMRVAIGLMVLGVIIVRLHAFDTLLFSQPDAAWQFSMILAVAGMIMVLLATKHYLAVRQDIDEDVYELMDRWVILVCLAITLMGAGVLYFMFADPW